MAKNTNWGFRATIVAIMANIFLVLLKITIGILIDSLSLIADGFDSCLDIFTAIIAYLGFWFASRPPDEDHHYGHSKLEALLALIITALLFLSSFTILGQAALRITSEKTLKFDFLGLLTAIVSIVTKISIAYYILYAGKRAESSAIIANGKNYRTDAFTSTLVGIAMVGAFFELGWLDAIIAILICLFIFYTGLEIAKTSFEDLLDRAPSGLTAQICATVESVEGVINCGRVRIRKSGAIAFVDANIHADPSSSLDKAHEIGKRVQSAIINLVGPADVMVHMHPSDEGCPLIIESIRQESMKKQFDWIKGVHNIHIFEFSGQTTIILHIEVIPTQSIHNAHNLASNFESHLKQIYPQVTEVVIHIEPFTDLSKLIISNEFLEETISALSEREHILFNCHDITMFPLGAGHYHATFHCEADPGMSVSEVHSATKRLEVDIQEKLPMFTEIIIHVEALNSSLK